MFRLFAAAPAKGRFAKVGVRFQLKDDDENALVELQTLQGKSLLRLVSQSKNNTRELSEYRILGQKVTLKTTLNYHGQRLLELLRSSKEYSLLPRLAVELGARHNVTGKRMNSAFTFYKMAMAAEMYQSRLKMSKEYRERGKVVTLNNVLMAAKNAHCENGDHVS